MAVEFKSVGSIGYTREGKTVTPGAPPGVAVGDLLVLACVWGPNSSVVDITPTGWFNIRRQISSESNASNEETVVPNGHFFPEGETSWTFNPHLQVDEGVDNHDGDTSFFINASSTHRDVVLEFPAESSGAILKELKLRIVVKHVGGTSGTTRVQLWNDGHGVGGAQQATWATFTGDYGSGGYTTLEFDWAAPQNIDERHGGTYQTFISTTNTRITAVELTYKVPAQKANIFTAYRVADGTADDTPTITYTDLQFKEFVAAIARFDGWGPIGGNPISSTVDTESTSQTSISLSYLPTFLKDSSMSLVVIGSDLGSGNGSASATGYTERLTTDGDTSEGSMTLSMLTAPVNEGDTGAGTFTFDSDPGTALAGPSGGFVKLGILIPIHSDLAFSPNTSGGALLGGSATIITNINESPSGGVIVGGDTFPADLLLSGEALINVIYEDSGSREVIPDVVIPRSKPTTLKPHTELNELSPQFSGLRYVWGAQHPNGNNVYELLRGQTASWESSETDISDVWVIDEIRGGYVLDLPATNTNDYFLSSNVPDIDGEDLISFSAWVTLDTLATTRSYLSKLDGTINPTGVDLQWRSGEGFALYFTSSGTTARAYTGTSGFTTGTWYHVVTVYDGNGSTNTDKIKIYVNGIEQSLTFNGTIPTSVPDGGGSLFIGAAADVTMGVNQYWNGKIDDVRIYGEALSSGQVGHMYNIQTRWDLYVEPQFSVVSTGEIEAPVAGVLAGGTADVNIGLFGNGGVLAGGTATFNAIYNIIIADGSLVGNGVLIGGIGQVSSAQAFITAGGIIVDGEGIEEIGEFGSGGILVGGIAEFNIIRNSNVAGGVIAGGISQISSAQAFIPAGGAIVGGEAIVTQSQIFNEIGEGGVLAGGIANLNIIYNLDTNNGILVGGEGQVSSAKILVPAGGAIAGGIAEVAQSKIFNEIGEGGVLAGGIANLDTIYNPNTNNGVIVGGIGQVSSAKIFTPAGGAIVGGIAEVAQSKIFNEVGEGGILAGGVANLNTIYNPNTNNGVLVGGEGQVSSVKIFIPTGGAIVGGEGIEEIGLFGQGGILVGGLANISIIYNPDTNNGTLVGGEAQESEEQTEPVAGGVLTGGSANFNIAFNPGTNNGILVGGISQISSTEAFIPDGGVIAGGEANVIQSGIIEEEGQGGILVGGLASINIIYNPDTNNGTLVGGEGQVSSAEAFIPTGGTLIGGEGVEEITENTAGGILVGGLANFNVIYNPNTNNGTLVGGTGQISSAEAFIPTGGAIAGGEADVLQSEIISETGEGGILAGGLTNLNTIYNPTTDNGILVGGTGQISSAEAFIPTGGTIAGGEGIETIGQSVLGGILVGGTANLVIIYNPDTNNGILAGGETAIQATYFTNVANGVLINGEADIIQSEIISEIGQGGTLVGGIANIVITYNLDTNNGVLVGGISQVSSAEAFIPTGGIKAGGEGVEEITENTAGGILVSGLADISIIYNPNVNNGLLIGGIGQVSSSEAFIPTGGIIATGEAILIQSGIIEEIGEGGSRIGGTGPIQMIYGSGSISESAPIAIPTISGAGPSKQKPHTQLNTQSTQFKGLRYLWPAQYPTGTNLYELMRGQDGTWLGTDASEPWNIDPIRGGYVLDLIAQEMGDIFSTPNNILEIDGEDILTFSAWVTMDSLVDGTRTYLAKMDDDAVNQTGFELSWVPGEGFTLFFDVNGTMSRAYTGTAGFTTDTWYHVVTVYNGNGSTNIDKVKIYVNAVEQSLTFNGTIPSQIPASNFGIYIGSSQDKTPEPIQHWIGKIDDIRIYSEALSSGQIGHMYNVQTRWELFAEPEFRTVSLGAVVDIGGILAGGIADISIILSTDTSGGIVVGGTALVSEAEERLTEGGILVGGTANFNIIYNPSTNNGVLAGGEAQQSEEQNEQITGGILVGGTANFNVIYNPNTNNGILVGGAGQESEEQTEQVTGGILVGGTANFNIIYNPNTNNGILVGGLAQESEEQNEQITGGVLAGGTANINIIYNPSINNGVLAGGAGQESEEQTEQVTGGILVGGTANFNVIYNPNTNNGVLVGGLAQESEEQIEQITGGILVGGTANFNIIYNPNTNNGILVSGIGQVSSFETFIADGGVVVSGEGVKEITENAVGGILVSGLAELNIVYNPNTNNGVLVGGEAISFLSFIPVISGGILVNGHTPEIHDISGLGGAIVNGEAIEEITENITGGTVINGAAIIGIQPNIVGGIIVGGTSIPGIQPGITGGVIAGGFNEPAFDGRGGILVGGAATVTRTFFEEGIGGAIISPKSANLFVEEGIGGITVNGSAIDGRIQTIEIDGNGLLASGTAFSSKEFASAGGILASGLAKVQEIQEELVDGGGVLASGAVINAFSEFGSGGIILGGIGHPAFAEFGSGGALFGGSSVSTIDFVYNGDGIIIVTGQAGGSNDVRLFVFTPKVFDFHQMSLITGDSDIECDGKDCPNWEDHWQDKWQAPAEAAAQNDEIDITGQWENKWQDNWLPAYADYLNTLENPERVLSQLPDAVNFVDSSNPPELANLLNENAR